MDGTFVLGIILTIIGGIALAFQSGTNSTLGIVSGSKPFSSAVSFGVGFLICLIYFAIDIQGLHHQLPSVAGIRSVPWWAWTGGALGSYYVIVVIIFAQKLGAGTLVATFVCAQLVTSIVLDLTGLVGFSRREFSWQRWLGVALMIAGVVLVTQFPGQTVKAVQAQAHHDSEAALDISNSSKHSRHLTMELQPCSITSASATSADAIVRVV